MGIVGKVNTVGNVGSVGNVSTVGNAGTLDGIYTKVRVATTVGGVDTDKYCK